MAFDDDLLTDVGLTAIVGLVIRAILTGLDTPLGKGVSGVVIVSVITSLLVNAFSVSAGPLSPTEEDLLRQELKVTSQQIQENPSEPVNYLEAIELHLKLGEDRKAIELILDASDHMDVPRRLIAEYEKLRKKLGDNRYPEWTSSGVKIVK